MIRIDNFVFFFLIAGVINLMADIHPAQKYRASGGPVVSAPDGTIFCEAEEFKVEKGTWQAKNWGENYFAATFANTFLSRKAFLGAPEQCEEAIAAIDVKIDEPGEYLVLARYEAPYRFETQFRVKIEQDGKILLDRLYGARENTRIWAFGQKLKKEVAWSWGAVENIVWEGHDVAVFLKQGTAKISLIAGKQPEPAAKRNIDIVMLTKDHQQVKTRIEKEQYLPLDGWLIQAGDVWMRIKNTGKEKITVKSLSFPGGPFQQHSPYWVHIRNWKPINVSVEPEQDTDWIEAGSTMDSLNDGQWGFSTTGPCIIEFGLKSASGQIEKINQFTLNEAGNLNLVGYADTRYCRKIETIEQAAEGYLKYLKNLKLYGKKPEKTLIFAYTTLKGIPELFGITTKEGIYVDWRGKTPAQLEEICKKLSEDQKKQIMVVSLGDEITLPAPKPSEIGEFVEYLKKNRVNPYDLDPTGEWNNIKLQDNDTVKKSNPALYYWSRRFRHHFGIQKIKEMTDVLRKYLPNAGIGANFSPHHGGYKHAYLGEVFQWINCFREDGLTMPWSEDYIWQLPVGSPQMNEINLDLFRSGIKGKPDRKIHYYVMPHWPGNTPNMWKRQFYAAIAHGAKIFNLFEFHPVWLAYTENHVSNPEMYEMVLKSFREYGLFEETVQSGFIRSADAGLWMSEIGDIWSDNEGSFTAGKRSLYIAIRNNQIPLDFIVDQDLSDGTISRYKTLFITDRHISIESANRISNWVKNGGTLFLTAGAGMFDEYNRKNTVIKQLLGFDQEPVESEESRIEYIKQDLPFAKKVEEIVMIEGKKCSIPVFGAISRINPPEDAVISGNFSDGSAAIVQINRGKGKIIYCSFLPGLSFFKPTIPLKPVDRGSTDDAMAHFIPTDFDKTISGLIKSAYSEEPFIIIKHNNEPAGFIETTIIESNNSMVIPVINWSENRPIKITVEIRQNIAGKRISAFLASGKPLSIKFIQEKNKSEMVFDIDIADAIMINW